MLRRSLMGVFFIFSCLLIITTAKAQVTDTTHPVSVDPDLIALSNSKIPKEYTIAGIKIVGTKYLDESLLVSISGLTVGDKVMISRGTEVFSKAINKLWNQNLFSNIAIYFTKLSGSDIYLEINVTERPRLLNFYFKGATKSEADDLKPKTGLVKGRVVTENMKQTAEQNIQKYYADKGFQSVTISINEAKDASAPNSESLTFNIEKGVKVRINQISFYNNKVVTTARLKQELKDTKEMTRMTLYPPLDSGAYGIIKPITLKEYIDEWGFLYFTTTREFLDPYFRFKLFSSAKFNAAKYATDKEKVLDYYNSLGYRDATIAADTQYFNKRGQMNIDIKVEEGNKYYFGNISWKGNTKYSDSLLSLLMGIKKGDVYNQDILNKKLGKGGAAEGADISGLYLDDGYLFFRVDPVETAV
jgi:outer membrane protein insertion porin family